MKRSKLSPRAKATFTQVTRMHPRLQRTIDQLEFRHAFSIFGVGISFVTNDEDAIGELLRFVTETFPNQAFSNDKHVPDFEYALVRYVGRKDTLVLNRKVILFRTARSMVWKFLLTHVRLHIAEHAVDRLFVHAGVVAWNGKAIVIPARSLQGKTTLTAELVKLGAVYYSDEYAIFDGDGLVHPCPKPLSIRPAGKFRQTDKSIDEIGGTSGENGIPVALIVFAKYKSGGNWRPRRLSPANCVIELLRNTIPIRRVPEFAVDVLTKVARTAITVRSTRGEAVECVPAIVSLLDSVMAEKQND